MPTTAIKPLTDKEVSKRLRTAFEWLKKDMALNTPKQTAETVKTRWIPHIEDVLRLIENGA